MAATATGDRYIFHSPSTHLGPFHRHAGLCLWVSNLSGALSAPRPLQTNPEEPRSPPPPPAPHILQALGEMTTISTKFTMGKIPDQPWFDNAKDIWEASTALFVTGLLIERFRTARDRVDLRNRVARDLDQLDAKHVSRDLLPPVLKTRAESALQFGVAV